MEIVKGRAGKLGGRSSDSSSLAIRHQNTWPDKQKPRGMFFPRSAPSVPRPERFPSREWFSREVASFGGPSFQWKAAFQSVIPKRSLGLSVSGAVAPSAPARRDER
jgi:hypothetical protein